MLNSGNYCNIYVDEHGRIFKTEDEIFLVSDGDTEAIITIYVKTKIGENVVGYASFKRSDGLKTINRAVELVERTVIDGDVTNEYYVFRFNFNEAKRLLDVAGSLEASFRFKSLDTEIEISTISTILLVRRNVKKKLNTTTEEEFYEEAIRVVENTQAKLNGHIVDYDNPHRVKADQVPISNTDSTTVATKLSEIDDTLEELEKGQEPIKDKVDKIKVKGIYAFDGNNQTHLPYNSNAIPETIPVRDSNGNIEVHEQPTTLTSATSKKYVDGKIADLIGLAPEELNTLKELADAYLSIGITSATKNVNQELTEEEVLNLWEKLEDGRYTLLSKEYGAELVFIKKLNNEYSRILPSGKVIAYDFEDLKWVQVSGGGGGGGDSSIITTTPITPTDFTSTVKSRTILELNWSSGISGNGFLYTYIDGELKNTKAVSQGNIYSDITDYVTTPADYAVKLIVEDANGNKKTTIYKVSIVELTIFSDFNDEEFFHSTIAYDYQAFGDVEKTMHFVLDGQDTTVNVYENGSKKTHYLNLNQHKVYDFKVYSTAIINGVEVKSNEYHYKIIYYEENNPRPLIATKFTNTKINQGEQLNINYIVYTPTTIYTPIVKHTLNGVVRSYDNIGRETQTWPISNYEVGENTILITAMNIVGEETYLASADFIVNVTETEMKIEAETNNLQLYLNSSIGKSNNDTDRDQWTYNDITTSFEGFNWNTNGWKLDKNNITALKLNGDARAVINYKPFARDIKSEGITIEIEFSTENVLNYDTTIINILNNNIGILVKPTEFIFKSENETITQGFKEDEKIRMAITIQKSSSNRFIQTYINGVLSGIKVYGERDGFDQLTASNIIIGSDECDTNIYKIRIYKAELEAKTILNNFIADNELLTEKQKLYNRNNILDSYGNVYYNYVKNVMPVLTITCDKLPDAEGVTNVCSIAYENKLNNNSLDFNFSNVLIEIQGTSSLQYFYKNFDFTLPDDIGASIQLYPNAIKEQKVTLKVDYASSAGVYNAGNAKIVNKIYEQPNPAQEDDSRVRNSIYGIPVAVFYRRNASENRVFHCKGSLNLSKKNNALGYKVGDESWEFRNNTSPLCLFNSNNFETIGTDFKARYLVEPTEPAEDYDKYKNLKEVLAWVYSCKDNPTKFKEEVENYFDLYYLKFYYIYFMVMGGIDSMAKNLMLTYFAKTGKWYPQFYDMDSAFGIDNSGRLSFNYNIEPRDKDGNDYAFNGSESVLWTLVKQVYDVNELHVEENNGNVVVTENEDSISYMYRDLRSKGLISYETMMGVLYNDGIELYPERIYNQDAIIKYINVYLNIGKNYLSSALGSTLDHLKFWVANRINYLDSKWFGEEYLNDRISCRITTPETVTPDYSLELKSYRDMYMQIQYGSYYALTRANRNTTYLLEPNIPEGTKFNDTETYIFGASSITEIGDLSKWYLSLFESGNLVKLSKLILGSQDPTYSNENLQVLTLSTSKSPDNYMLRYLDISNCTGLTSSLDLSKLYALETFYGLGTKLTSISFAKGGQLKTVHLPDTLTTLTLQKQNNITDFNFEPKNLVNITVEDSNVDTLSLVEKHIDNLNRVRLIGINWTVNDLSLLDKLLTKQGYTESGANYHKSVLAGTITITSSIYSDQVESYREYWGTSLTINATGGIIPRYVCKFYNDDVLLDTQRVFPNGNVTYGGELPTKEYDGEGHYAYNFVGWDKPLTNITANTNFYAQFELVPYYQVVFQDYLGNSIQTSYVPSGTLAEYKGATPTKPTDNTLQEKYTFSSWSPDISVPITGNTIFTPLFTIQKFWKVRWLNWDNTPLVGDYFVDDGKFTSYKGNTPTRPNDDNYSYVFSRWSPNPSTTPITQNTDFIAQFVESKLITVTWLNSDGSTLLTKIVGQGQQVTYTGAEPTKPNDAQYKNYVFTNWLGSDGKTYENTITSVPYQLTLTPQFIGILQVYNVYWKSEGTILGIDQVPYGGTAVYNGATPVHSQGYSFAGWGTDDFVIKGDTTFNAVFDKPDGMVEFILDDSSLLNPQIRFGRFKGTTEVTWSDGEKQTIVSSNNSSWVYCTKPTPITQIGTYSLSFKFNIEEIYPYDNNPAYYIDDNYKKFVSKVQFSDKMYKIIEYLLLPSTNNSSYKNEKLKEVTIPSNITIIEAYAFSQCTALETVVLNDGLETIKRSVFYKCSSLKEIIIPNSVTSLEYGNFYGCSNLTKVKMSKNVLTITNNTFRNCTSLLKIDFSENISVPTLTDTRWTFENVPKTCQVIIPDNLYDEWINTTNWNTLYTNGSLQFVKKSEEV